MGILLYGDWKSQPSRAVAIMMTLNNIEFDFKYVDLVGGGSRTEEYRTINPCQTVPVLIEGDFKLIESVAILKYLAVKDGVSEHWYPSDPQRRAKVDEYMSWQHTGIRPKSIEAMLETVWKPLVMKLEVPEETKIEKSAALEKQLELIESYFLGDKPFLTGPEITIADLMCSMELASVNCLVVKDLDEKHPKLTAYLSRVSEKLSPHFDKYNETIEKHGREMYEKIGKDKIS